MQPVRFFTGLSTDTKPTDSHIGAGSRFWATDLGIEFVYDGDSWQIAGRDYLTKSVISGNVYSYSDTIDLLASATKDISIKTNGKPIIILTAEVEAITSNVRVEGYSGSTVTSVGAALPLRCTNIQLNKTPSTVINVDPVITNIGTLEARTTAFGETLPNRASPASESVGDLFVLPSNTYNVFRITNLLATATPINIKIKLQEVDL